MAPRQNENTMVIASNRPNKSISPASRPSLFELPKDISFLGIQHPSFPTAENVVRQRMASSLEQASQRAKDIQKRLEQENKKPQCPVVHEACRSALVNEMSKSLVQASLLLEDAKKEDDKNVSLMTKNKRLSVSLINALQYLDTLESAMAFSSRDRLETGLLAVLNSIAAKCKDDDALDVDESLDVCVSSWKAPCLAFDFRVGKPALPSVPALKEESLPIEVEVNPIIEFTAEELIQGGPRERAEAFHVCVKKCSHEKREYGARDGITGEAMIQVHIEPLADSKSKKEVVWGVNTEDVEPVRVKEVRATQQNAYPTKFRMNCNMYSSTVYGESGLTLTLALETSQTMDGKVPKVNIELVCRCS